VFPVLSFATDCRKTKNDGIHVFPLRLRGFAPLRRNPKAQQNLRQQVKRFISPANACKNWGALGEKAPVDPVPPAISRLPGSARRSTLR
jgi:hypothetical protein